MRTLTIKIAAGETEEIAVKGNYVRVRTAPCELIIENPDTSEKVEASQGDDFELSAFKRLKVTNNGAIDSIFKLTISQDKKAGSAPGVISGSVSLAAPVLGVGSNEQKTVGVASASLVAANLSRKFLAIQNKDASGKIYINFGSAATVNNGLRIDAGGYFELNSNVLTAEIFAIGDIANSNIVVIEG